MYGIGAVVGTVVGTGLGQGVGRRAALMMLCLPDILAWVIAALANNILMIKVTKMSMNNEFWILKMVFSYNDVSDQQVPGGSDSGGLQSLYPGTSQ